MWTCFLSVYVSLMWSFQNMQYFIMAFFWFSSVPITRKCITD
jgi:hypothetical protein